MKKSLWRTTLGALVVLAAVPSMASAAFTPTIAQSGVASGCGPKGAVAIPLPAPAGIAAGAAQYKVTAVVGGAETAPCAALPSGAASGFYVTALAWAATPGATEYRVYRNDARIQVLPANATVCPTANAAGRCQTVDQSGTAQGGASGTAPALPAGVTQAGGHPDLNITQAFDYSGATNSSADDTPPNGTTANSASLRENILHFPAGLLASAVATAETCSISQLIGAPSTATGGAGQTDANEDKCPRGSLVGQVTAQIFSNGRTTPTIGDIYLGQKINAADTSTARLYVALRPPCSQGYPAPLTPGSDACATTLSGATSGPLFEGAKGLEIEKSFLSARATIRSDGTFGIDNVTTSVATGADELLAPVSNVRVRSTGAIQQSPGIQVRSLTQTLFGTADQGTQATADDRFFVTLPTSCAAKTLSADSSSYLDQPLRPATVALQATNCEAVPFTPELSARLDVSGGQSGQNGHPGFTANIVQTPDEAATRTATVKLPAGIGTNIAALSRLCTTAQQNSAAGCPASSIVGSASATTSVLPGVLSGPVYVAANESPYNTSGLPKLIVALNGAARITFEGSIALDATENRIVNVFDNLPEVTLSTFALTINGGDGGLLNNSRNLCTSPLTNIDATFVGHNGKTVTQNPAVVSNQAYYCITNPPPGGKVTPGLSLKVKPKKDTKKPFKFTASGKVGRKSAAKGAACRGNVKITVRKGGKTIAKKAAKVKSSCTYKAKVKLTKKAGKKGTAKFTARFGGNSVLKAKSAKAKAKYGAKKRKGGKRGK